MWWPLVYHLIMPLMVGSEDGVDRWLSMQSAVGRRYRLDVVSGGGGAAVTTG